MLLKKNNLLIDELMKSNGTLEQKVKERTKKLHDLNEELYYHATRDGLTGLFNRRHFIAKVREQIEKAKDSITMMLLDIDDFKQTNDRYGHTVGDRMLVDFAKNLKTAFASESIYGRVGGEEFAIFFIEKNIEDILIEAKNFRELVANSPILVDKNVSIKLTFSGGIATAKDKTVQLEELYKAAARSLYQSKKSGNNKVKFSSLEE